MNKARRCLRELDAWSDSDPEPEDGEEETEAGDDDDMGHPTDEDQPAEGGPDQAAGTGGTEADGDPPVDYDYDEDGHDGQEGRIDFNVFGHGGHGQVEMAENLVETHLTGEVARSRSRSRDRDLPGQEEPAVEPMAVDDAIADARAARDRAIALWEQRLQAAADAGNRVGVQMAEDEITRLTHIL